MHLVQYTSFKIQNYCAKEAHFSGITGEADIGCLPSTECNLSVLKACKADLIVGNYIKTCLFWPTKCHSCEVSCFSN